VVFTEIYALIKGHQLNIVFHLYGMVGKVINCLTFLETICSNTLVVINMLIEGTNIQIMCRQMLESSTNCDLDDTSTRSRTIPIRGVPII